MKREVYTCDNCGCEKSENDLYHFAVSKHMVADMCGTGKPMFAATDPCLLCEDCRHACPFLDKSGYGTLQCNVLPDVKSFPRNFEQSLHPVSIQYLETRVESLEAEREQRFQARIRDARRKPPIRPSSSNIKIRQSVIDSINDRFSSIAYYRVKEIVIWPSEFKTGERMIHFTFEARQEDSACKKRESVDVCVDSEISNYFFTKSSFEDELIEYLYKHLEIQYP